MKILVSIIFGILFINVPIYQKSTQQNLNNDKFFEIKYEELLKQKNSIKLSQVASEVKYIQLETNEKCLIYPYAKYYFSDNFIFVNNRDHILKFSSDGKFIKQIGTPGRGPGEITSITTTSIIPEKKWIVLYDFIAHKLRYFNFDGNLVKTINLAPFRYVKVIDNITYIAISNVNSVASEKYTHLLLNESGETLSSVKNPESWKSVYQNNVLSISSPTFEPFYTYRNNHYFKSMYNDTVYVVNANRIQPSFFINLGKYRIPEEKRFERLSPAESKMFNENTSGYYFSYVFEAGDRLFLTTNEWGGDTKIGRFTINKKSLVENSDDKNSGIYKGYIDNDWDGGALFWPKGSFSDNTVFMPIYIKDLKDIINFRRSSKSLKTMVKFPDKRAQMEKMVLDLDISDNPILMIVTLK